MRKISLRTLISLQLKRVLRHLPISLCLTLLLCLISGLFAVILLQKDGEQDNKMKVRVGVVGDISESYLGVGIQAVQYLDDSQYFMEILELTKEEASRMLTRGEINSYLVVPAGFIDAVVSGENIPATYYTTDGQEGIGTAITKEIIGTVSKLVLESQSGIYSLQEYMRMHGTPDYWYHVDDLNVQYIYTILDRNNMFEIKTVGVSNSLSTYGYYFCGILLLVLLLWGLTASSFFLGQDEAFTRLLKAKGYDLWKQVVAQYLAYFCMMLVSFGLLFSILVPLSNKIQLPVEEWMALSAGEQVAFSLRFIPVVILVAGLQFLLYELSTGVLDALLYQFVGAISIGYISGCLYPMSYFPKGMQIVGNLLPTGVARIYLCDSLRGEFSILPFLGMLLYLAGMLLLATWIRKRKVEGRL